MKKPQPLPEPRTIDLPRRDYQPSKAELEEEIDLPKASLKTVRSAFFRPFNIIHKAAAPE